MEIIGKHNYEFKYAALLISIVVCLPVRRVRFYRNYSIIVSDHCVRKINIHNGASLSSLKTKLLDLDYDLLKFSEFKCFVLFFLSMPSSSSCPRLPVGALFVIVDALVVVAHQCLVVIVDALVVVAHQDGTGNKETVSAGWL